MSRQLPLLPTNAIGETFSRGETPITDIGALLTGRLSLVACPLPRDVTISNISFISGATPAGTPTHQLFGLYSSGGALLASSADALTGAWAANTVKTLAMGTPFAVTVAGLYYLGIMVTATTVPSLLGFNGSAVINALAPVLAGTSTTGLTTALPNPAGAMTAVAGLPYAYVS